MQNILLRATQLKKHFPVEKAFLARMLSREKKFVHAVDGVSFNIRKGETFGLVGETGCGKTTTGRLVLRLIEPTAGEVSFDGHPIFELNKEQMRKMRREMQIIFQNPFASLNPRQTVGSIVAAPLEIHGLAKDERKVKVTEALEKVGLTPASQFFNKYPHELSGGQRQRVGIARALILNPKFIVADEPVASLDVSIRSQILNLMQSLKREFELTYLLITHDFAVVRYMSDQVAVMHLGKIVEMANNREIFESPQHPYTKALMSAIPAPNPNIKRKKLSWKGEVPSPITLPSGCRLHTRCPWRTPKCEKEEPELVDVGNGHYVACHRKV